MMPREMLEYNIASLRVAGVVLGAIVANVVPAGIASINGMAVAALCYVIGELKK